MEKIYLLDFVPMDRATLQTKLMQNFLLLSQGHQRPPLGLQTGVSWNNFCGLDLKNLDLRGLCFDEADFTASDFRGALLDVRFVKTYSIYQAHFTEDALPWLMLRPNWTRECEHVYIHPQSCT
jgi:uncharacterized protein YjbI with pentapeptide repeats